MDFQKYVNTLSYDQMVQLKEILDEVVYKFEQEQQDDWEYGCDNNLWDDYYDSETLLYGEY